MSCVITIRSSLKKIKIWHNVSSPDSLYSSLMVNRGIPSSDLDIYSVNCGSSELLCKEDYVFSDPNTLELRKSFMSGYDSVTELCPWGVADMDSYSEAVQQDVIHNQKNPSDLREIPDGTRVVMHEKYDYEVVQTISVTKLNPFV
jgi:hypothetical protein